MLISEPVLHSEPPFISPKDDVVWLCCKHHRTCFLLRLLLPSRQRAPSKQARVTGLLVIFNEQCKKKLCAEILVENVINVDFRDNFY